MWRSCRRLINPLLQSSPLKLPSRMFMNSLCVASVAKFFFCFFVFPYQFVLLAVIDSSEGLLISCPPKPKKKCLENLIPIFLFFSTSNIIFFSRAISKSNTRKKTVFRGEHDKKKRLITLYLC